MGPESVLPVHCLAHAHVLPQLLEQPCSPEAGQWQHRLILPVNLDVSQHTTWTPPINRHSNLCLLFLWQILPGSPLYISCHGAHDIMVIGNVLLFYLLFRMFTWSHEQNMSFPIFPLQLPSTWALKIWPFFFSMIEQLHHFFRCECPKTQPFNSFFGEVMTCIDLKYSSVVSVCLMFILFDCFISFQLKYMQGWQNKLVFLLWQLPVSHQNSHQVTLLF